MKLISKCDVGRRTVYDLSVPKTQCFVTSAGPIVHNSGAQSFIKNFKPTSVMDIAVATAIYRPGPLTAHVDKIYIEARQNPDNVVYEHRLVESVLKPYFGTVIFQETMMSLANIVGGFSLDQTDDVRKALMKRSMDGKDAAAVKQKELGEKFVIGAVKNGLSESDATSLWKKILAFSGYAFNAAHSVSYAYDSVACAWLFTYYPDEWLCAWLESASGNPVDRAQAIGEVKRYGYQIVTIDINEAVRGWTILPGKKMMASFMSIKGVGDAAIDEIVQNRPYNDIVDLLWNEDGSWRHSKANKKVWDTLTKLGAFDSMNLVGDGCIFSNYRQLNYVLTEGMDRLKKKNGVNCLKEVLEEALELEDWTQTEKAKFHQELAGDMDVEMLISDEMQKKLLGYGVPEISAAGEGKSLVWFVLQDFIEKKTKNGKNYLLLTAIDTSGKSSKIFLWGGSSSMNICIKNDVYITEVQKSDFGYSSSVRKLKRLVE